MELSQELNAIKNRIGLVNSRLKINEYDETEKSIKASINPVNWDIEISINKKFNPIKDKRQKAYARKKGIKDGKRKILEDILHHELAHWELPFNTGYGCPYDTYHHDLILEAVKKALPKEKQSQSSYVANAFEDMIINPRCNEFKGDFSGQLLFWDNEGIEIKETGKKHYTPFYEAFVKLNLHLFGDKADRLLLKKYFSNDNKIDEAVNKVIADLELEKNIKDTSVLFIKENWPKMASIFAKNLSNLLDQKPTERLSAFSHENEEGQGDEQSGNGIEQKMRSKEGKEEIAYGRYKNNKGQSSNITSYEQLDSLYKRLAKAIPVHVETMAREQGLPITPLNFRPFDQENDDIRKIKPTKLYFNDKGITFGYPKDQLIITSKSKIQKKSFPDFKMILLDNSGSMREGINGSSGDTSFIPWGNESKYHYALLGFYGMEQFLQLQGISQYISHGLSLFSSKTRYEESNFQNLQKLRKLALSPEFGNTHLDVNVLLDSLRGRESFVLSISDGEIYNWDESKSEFLKLASQNYFAHIQIGSNTGFTEDLEKNNIPVFYVNSGEDLSRLMVNITTKTYQEFTKK